jgi:hypothetical protein
MKGGVSWRSHGIQYFWAFDHFLPLGVGKASMPGCFGSLLKFKPYLELLHGLILQVKEDIFYFHEHDFACFLTILYGQK